MQIKKQVLRSQECFRANLVVDETVSLGRAVVVAQLAQRVLPILEVRGLNAVK